MEQLNLITNFLRIKDKNITILDYVDAGTHKEVFAKLVILLLNATAVMVRWLNMTSRKNIKSLI